MNQLKKWFWLILVVLMVGVFIYFNEPNRDYYGGESEEFYSCINDVHSAFDNFWINYEDGEFDGVFIRDLNNVYQQEKEHCYIAYHSDFLIFGESMTDREISKKVLELEGYIRPRIERVFDGSPVDVQLEFYQRIYSE